MNKHYLKLLRLDSIYRFLTWEDRIRIHLLMQYKIKAHTYSIAKGLGFLEKTEWEAPEILYDQSRLLYYEDEKGNIRAVEEYPKLNPTLTEQLKNFEIL